MNKIRLAAILTLAGLLAACQTTRHAAPVVDITPARGGDSRPSVTPPPPARGQDSRENYTVKKGDTLIRIALDHGQNYRDLVTWNNLANPNDIKVDQVLRVAPPEAGNTPQTSSIAMPPTVSEVKPPPSLTPAGTPVSNKNSPRAEKKAYSESALAELQKPEVGAPAPVASVTPAVIPSVPPPVNVAPPVAVAKPAGKPAPPSAEEESVGWIWPSEGKVIAGFDEGKNKGIDIAGKMGQHVVAAGAGKVMYAGSGIRGYGNLVIVKHSNNLLSAYAHNQTILVKEGQNVSKGQMIAEMGNSDSDAVMLHFEIRQQGKPVDPSRFLPNRTQ